jgi:hypothetical protein
MALHAIKRKARSSGKSNRLFFLSYSMEPIENDTSMLHCHGNVCAELLPSSIGGDTDRPRLSFDKTLTTLKMMRLTVLLLLSIIVASGTCLPSFSRQRLEDYTCRQTDEGIYEAHHRDGLSCHDINTSFIKMGSGIQKLMWRGAQRRDHISILQASRLIYHKKLIITDGHSHPTLCCVSKCIGTSLQQYFLTNIQVH